MKLTLDKANVIADQTLAKARAVKYRPMCVAVLDDGGCLKVLKREDAASILRPDIAIGKAWGAVGMGESSRSLSRAAQGTSGFSRRPIGDVPRQSRAGGRRRADHGRR